MTFARTIARGYNEVIAAMQGDITDIESVVGSIPNWQVDTYKTAVEQYSLLPVNGTSVAVYSLLVPSMLPNDIVFVTGQFEVTNDLGYTCGVARMLVRATNATAISGTAVAPAVNAMDNVTPDRHHFVSTVSGIEVFPGSGNTYYNLVIGAVSTAGTSNLTIESGYGGVSVIRLRKL